MRTDQPPAIIRAFKQTLPSNDHYRHPNDDHAEDFYSEIESTFFVLGTAFNQFIIAAALADVALPPIAAIGLNLS